MPVEPLQIVCLIGYIVLLVLSVRWVWRNHGRRLYSVPTMIYSLHGVFFYVSTMLDRAGLGVLEHSVTNQWSQSLRLNDIIVVVLLLLVLEEFIRREKK